jgi:protein-disulfide isomerase
MNDGVSRANITMKLFQNPWFAATTTSTIAAAVAIGVSLSMNKGGDPEALPDAVAKYMTSQEEARLAARQNEILAEWDKAASLNEPGKRIYGSMQAEFTLVEYSDLECSFCKRFHATPKALVDQSGGRINWEYQHYPLGFHNPVAEKAAHAAECVAEQAGNKAFWAFTGQWFERSAMNGQGYADTELLAQELGAKPEAFRECMASGKYKELIAKQVERGTALGVTGTPATVVVDNTTGRQLLVKGAQQPQALLQAMSQLMEQRNQPPTTPNQDKAES